MKKKIKVESVMKLNENPTATEKALQNKEKELVKAIKLEIKNEIPDPQLFQKLLENRDRIKRLRETLERERENR